MSRPFRLRRVCCRPDCNYFKPRGIPINMLEEINLTMDEFEAVRLADLEGMYQEYAAKKMNISRQTFSNIVTSAHKKIADCLTNAKALRIEGGVIKMVERYFVCYDCKHEWTLSYGAGRPKECPKCKSSNIHRSPHDKGWSRTGWGFGHRFGHGRGRCGRTSR